MFYLVLFVVLAIPIGDCLVEHGWEPPEATQHQEQEQ